MAEIADSRVVNAQKMPLFMAAAALVTIITVQCASAQTYKFKAVNIPGATETVLLGGAGGTILANGYDSSGNPTCTLIKGKAYIAISDPNAAPNATYCHGIDTAGEVVGYYNTTSNATVGFTYSNGTFSDFSLPGISGALPIAISTNGIMAGYYYDQNNAPWGFTLKGTKVTTFQISGAASIFPVGVNSHSELSIQEFDTSGSLHCLVGNEPSFSELTVPGATETVCHGVNNNGKSAGSYLDSTGAANGFAYDPATSSYYTIDDPGMANTGIEALTSSEILYGYYRATGSGPRQGMKATGSFP